MALRFSAWALTLAPIVAACGETFVTGDGGGGQGTTDDGNGTDGQASGGSTSDDEAGSGGNGSTLCGNSSIDPDEECDDGNTERGDSCDSQCLVEVSLLCGNGELNPLVLEQCDDGNSNSGDGCSVRCQIEPGDDCGDGELRFDQGEECDDKNQVSGDGCSHACQLEGLGLFCGDDTLQQNEKCDDGNSGNGDGCSPTCTLTGKVTTVAGAAGMSGNVDGTGENARFGFLSGIAVGSRYVYFGDIVGMTTYLKRYDPETKLVKTLLMVAGGIEAIATDGGSRIWIAGGFNPSIQEIEDGDSPEAEIVAGGKPACTTTSCFEDGDGLNEATFGGVRGLAWYDGLLYVVDPNAAVLRTFDPESKEVKTVAGSPFAVSTVPQDGSGAEARFESPRYLASNNSGILFISDTNGAAIRTFNVGTGAVGTFAGNGIADYSDGKGDSVGIHRPRGITTDASSFYFVEADMHTIRQGVFTSGAVSTLAGFIDNPGAGDGAGINARFNGPSGVVYHHGERALFVLDSGNHLIRRID